MVRDEGKRMASERQAYLFTNCLLLCKRVERRTTLAPSMVSVAGGQPVVLRIKRRIPLETVHVIDSSVPLSSSRPDTCTHSASAVQRPNPSSEGTSIISTGTLSPLSRYSVSGL